MHGQPALDLDLSVAPETLAVADIVYVPLLTPLLARAQTRGLRTVSGLGMLLHQAVPGFAAWFGVTPVVDGDTHDSIAADLIRAMRIVGLTGGIGMGKSTAAAALRRAGVPVFDADAAVHRLQARGGRALPAIAAAFPGTVRDGVLDRAALRASVLADRTRLHRLEAILHPLVRAEQRRFLARSRAAGATLVVLDVPLLFETGGAAHVDAVMVVSAPRAIQRARVRRRGRMSETEIDRIIALQVPEAERLRLADVVIRTGLSRFHAVRAIRRWLSEEGWGTLSPKPPAGVRDHEPSS